MTPNDPPMTPYQDPSSATETPNHPSSDAYFNNFMDTIVYKSLLTVQEHGKIAPHITSVLRECAEPLCRASFAAGIRWCTEVISTLKSSI